MVTEKYVKIKFSDLSNIIQRAEAIEKLASSLKGDAMDVASGAIRKKDVFVERFNKETGEMFIELANKED